MSKEDIERLIKLIEAFRLELCKANKEGCRGCPSSSICDSAVSVWAKLIRMRAVKSGVKNFF